LSDRCQAPGANGRDRIHNPDDQEYFKSVISGINRELLDQLPALAQQQAIVLGDCVKLPLQVRVNTVDPRPRSEDPPFTPEWMSKVPKVSDIETDCCKVGREDLDQLRRRRGRNSHESLRF
jgi:DNA helicase HerA-like ATPase